MFNTQYSFIWRITVDTGYEITISIQQLSLEIQ